MWHLLGAALISLFLSQMRRLLEGGVSKRKYGMATTRYGNITLRASLLRNVYEGTFLRNILMENQKIRHETKSEMFITQRFIVCKGLTDQVNH